MASAKLDVDISGLQANINTAKGIMKGLNAEMKATEAEFKNTGNAEQYLANKTKTLNSQLNMQKAVADSAEKALQQMRTAGVDPADASYQKMYATLMNAQAGMNEAQASLNELGQSAQQAAVGADQLTNSVQGISKKISLDQVISGIDKITGGLENAAKKAVKLGEDLWNSIMEQAKWADDTATMAQMYGIDLDTFQRMQKLVTNGMDTTVEAILTSQSKLKNGIGKNTKATMEALNDLGISLQEWQTVAGQSGSSLVSRDMIDVFWEAGQAIMSMSEASEQEAKAQALFGRSWHELVPLFTQFKTVEEYNDALSKVKVNSEEDVNALAELNDKVSELKGNFDTLSRDVLAQLAPALTDAANALNGLLEGILDYLETPEGKQMLESLSDSVSGLFDDLGKIDPQSVVENFTNVFNTLIGGLQWIVDNKDIVIGALGAIVAGWGALKIGGSVASIIKLIDGLRDLGVIGGGAAATGGKVVGGGLATAISNGVANILPGIASWVSTNGGPVMDWLTNESPIAPVLNGNMSIGDWFNQQVNSIQQNASTFVEDWKNNVLFRGLLQGLTGGFAFGTGETGPDENEELIRQDLERMMTEEPFDFVAEPQVPDDAAKSISEQVGTVTINAQVAVTGMSNAIIGGGGGGTWKMAPKANGIPFVPYDGYIATLHRGEQVVPAREVSSRSFSSNLYVENMNMGGSMDADALANAIASRNRRMMAGYGS